mmetsp:Transcript_23448/g.65080  ORF Transcript_23448/g.65080 Transcript_23448/m.65080 type:complete len:1077 (-) Transcript_23448:2841-6071(-)
MNRIPNSIRDLSRPTKRIRIRLVSLKKKSTIKMKMILLLGLIVLVVSPGRWSHQHLACDGFSISSLSSFHGARLQPSEFDRQRIGSGTSEMSSSARGEITMRKQKASDRRTRRMQRGGEELAQDMIRENLSRREVTITSSPMSKKGEWKQRRQGDRVDVQMKSGGRGRSKKRSLLYNSLSLYHNSFLNFLTTEYKAEEEEVTERINSSIEDPIGLELAGHALLDMYAERRGNLFSDEIYRLVKAKDATTNVEGKGGQQILPPNNKFSKNDVILLTLQPMGTGDFFDPRHLPTSSSATKVEARVLNRGPTYIDVAINAGAFEANFGPAPNNEGPSGRGDPAMRLRADRFFSSIPYERMVEALTRISSIPERDSQPSSEGIGQEREDSKQNKKTKAGNNKSNGNFPYSNICMDDLLRETVISSHAFTDPSNPMFHDVDSVDLVALDRRLAQPPMPSSVKLGNQVLNYVQSNSGVGKAFKPLNAPQLAAIGAALTRKLTLIQGPPGTGKTTTAGVIGFGFTHQCRSLSPNAKVLASAFSNAGADNLAEGFLQLGLKVVRIGKASAISESLWRFTLDAAIDADPEARKASKLAASATAQLMKIRKDKKNKNSNGAGMSERAAQEIATAAVKRSIRACNIAATKAMREADIIVSTCTGAADPRLMAACGLNIDPSELSEGEQRYSNAEEIKRGQTDPKSGTNKLPERTVAPDGLPPLSLPFIIVDEACQSVEPGTLIPLTASNSCRSLVLLGDPCQLPATVKSDPGSPFSVSLMERLAATLPAPRIKMKHEDTEIDLEFTDALPVKQARSYLRSQSRDEGNVSYRKRFAGCLLLSLQYRMHPSIAAFSSAIFYDGLLASPTSVASQRPFPAVLSDSMPCNIPGVGVRMINVGGRCNEMKGESNKYTETLFSSNVNSLAQDTTTTYRNEAEALRVVSLIKEVLEFDHKYNPHDAKQIGVISPYNGQVHLIKRLLADDADIISLVRSTSAIIEVNSVDGYQGRERDVIIFSTVRSNHQGNIGFLTDWRRLNVALTRAKSALLVVGDKDTLSEGDKYWGAFTKWCESTKCLVEESEERDECNVL